MLTHSIIRLIVLAFGVLFSLGSCDTQSEESLGLDLCNGKLSIFRPSESSNSCCILILPGGGYTYHDLYSINYWIPEFCKRGYTVALFYYDLPNGEAEKTIESVLDAIKELRNNANIIGIDSKKIGIMGVSAGAHLAAMVSSRLPKEELPLFQILSSPLLSMESDITHSQSLASCLGENVTAESKKKYTPIYLVNNSTPPTFITVSLDDYTVSPENALRYTSSLLEHNINVKIFSVPTGLHAREPDWTEWDEITNDVFRWIPLQE